MKKRIYLTYLLVTDFIFKWFNQFYYNFKYRQIAELKKGKLYSSDVHAFFMFDCLTLRFPNDIKLINVLSRIYLNVSKHCYQGQRPHNELIFDFTDGKFIIQMLIKRRDLKRTYCVGIEKIVGVPSPTNEPVLQQDFLGEEKNQAWIPLSKIHNLKEDQKEFLGSEVPRFSDDPSKPVIDAHVCETVTSGKALYTMPTLIAVSSVYEGLHNRQEFIALFYQCEEN